ncbi:NUDIX domain-containing protein [Candidatus Bathyarchaeota archaeon]|nr:MAG: NUDIX domain-containing protein [Candidatus Bathyarchaeota archaeon]
MHRAERIDDPWSGQIGLPGGRITRSDPSARAALRREVSEEIGLDLDKDGDELGTLSLGSPMRRLEMKVQNWSRGSRGLLGLALQTPFTQNHNGNRDQRHSS